MKLKKLLLMGLAAVGFMACSSNDDLGTNEAKTSEGDAYASFTIDLGSPYLSTRAAGDDLSDLGAGDEHVGTASEQEVKRVRAVMYAGGVVAHAIDYDVKSSSSSVISGTDVVEGQSDKYHFVTVAKKVKKQDYEVAIIVNPTTKAVAATNTGRNKDELINAVVTAKASDFNSQKAGFMMTNAQGLVKIEADELKTSEKAAQEEPVKVQVDRVLAKVAVHLSNSNGSVGTNETDQVKVKDWTLDITNKKMYYLRHIAPTVEMGEEDADTPRAARYAKDPNFKLGNFAGVDFAERMEVLKAEFNFYTLGTDDKAWNTFFAEEQTKPDLANHLYALENTFEGGKENAVESQATRVVLRATYKPHEIGKMEESWFSYAGKPFQVEDLTNNFQLALTKEWNSFIENVPTTFVNEMKNLVFFSAYIANLEDKLEDKDAEDLSEYDQKFVGDDNKVLAKYKRLAEVVQFEEGAVDEINEAIQQAIQKEKEAGFDRPAGYVYNVEISKGVAAKITLDTSKPFAVGNLKYYLNGDSYYFIYVKHFDHANVADAHAYGRYGLVRNNVYKVNINSINKPGEPVITPPVQGEPTIPTVPTNPENPDPVEPKPETPEKPIDDEFNYVSYNVEILPWVVRTQTEDL